MRDGLNEAQLNELLALAERQRALQPNSVSAQIAELHVKFRLAATPATRQALAKELLSLGKDAQAQVSYPLALADVGRITEDAKLMGRAIRSLAALDRDHPALTRLRESLQMLQLGPDAVLWLKQGTAPALRVAGIYLVVCAALWTVSHLKLFGMSESLGQTEAFWQPTSLFWWFRRLSLIGFAFLGYRLAIRAPVNTFFRTFSWEMDARGVGLAVALGVGSGMLSARWENLETSLPVLLLMALFHVVAEQLFFTGFVLRVTERTLPNPVLAVIGGALLYGLYHLTYWASFGEIPLSWALLRVGLVTLGGGLPYALLYTRFKNPLFPFLCHLLVMSTVILHSKLLG